MYQDVSTSGTLLKIRCSTTPLGSPTLAVINYCDCGVPHGAHGTPHCIRCCYLVLLHNVTTKLGQVYNLFGVNWNKPQTIVMYIDSGMNNYVWLLSISV